MEEIKVGKKIERLTVLKIYKRNSRLWCECSCECSPEKIIEIRADHLARGETKSCGCLQREKAKAARTHGLTKTRIYRIWVKMKERCENPNDPKYYRYGKRGISVCDEWRNNFKAFYDWAMKNGYAENLSINRQNNDGNYCPDNCEWATKKQQANNTGTNRFITHKGKKQTLQQWADECGISSSTLKSRLDVYKWTMNEALSIQPCVGNNQFLRKEQEMRTNLKVLRVRNHLTQKEMAKKLGVSRATYSFVENNQRQGTSAFWEAVQRVFDVPDEEMYKLMKGEEREAAQCEATEGK